MNRSPALIWLISVIPRSGGPSYWAGAVPLRPRLGWAPRLLTLTAVTLIQLGGTALVAYLLLAFAMTASLPQAMIVVAEGGLHMSMRFSRGGRTVVARLELRHLDRLGSPDATNTGR